MKKQMAWACLAACLALPVAAQEEAPAEEAAADVTAEPVAADAAPAEEIAAEPAVIDDGSGSESAPAEEAAPVEEVASEDSSSEDSGSSDEGEGGSLNLYVGLEFDQTKVDIDEEEVSAALGRSRFDADFYKLRLGARIFDGVGVELHAGFPAGNASEDELEVKQFYGLYLVPTGVILETVEISARLGYAFVELDSELGSDDADGASFGLAAELPLRAFGDGMPNLRLGIGGTVYQEERSGRMYGMHAGIRYDFSL
jgi:hypothetical protein